MSHSVFRDLDDDKTSGNGTRGEVAENNLIVFIGKDGDVQVDPNALQDLIVNANTDTKSTVSVIRLGSPTPSMETDDGESSTKQSDGDENDKSGNDDDDDDEDEEGSKNSGESNEESDQDGASMDKGQKLKKKKKKNKVPGIGLTVEEFYNPEQAIQFATEIMNIAGITNPKQLKADYEHLRNIIQNDHCYTPYTYADSLIESKSNDASDGVKNESKSKLKLPLTSLPSSTVAKKFGRGAGQSSKSTPSNGLDISNSARNRSVDDANSSNENTADQNESDEEEAESETDFSNQSESENDRDSDLDFSVNDCHSRRAKKIKKRKVQAKRLANKKRRQSTIDFTGSDDNQTPKGRKTTKLPKKSLNTSAKSVVNAAATAASPTVLSTSTKLSAATSASSRITKVTYVKEMPASQQSTSHENLTSKSSPIPKVNSTSNSQVMPTSSGEKKLQKVLIMRPKVRTENTMSDMSSLFMPDVVVKPRSTADNTVVINKTPVVLNKTIAVSTPTAKMEMTTKTLKPVVLLQSLGTTHNMTTPRFVTTSTKLVKSPAITFRKAPPKPAMNLASEQDKQLDLIDSLLQEKLNKSEPDTASSTLSTSLSDASQTVIPADIPNIVKMLETSEASAAIETTDLLTSSSASNTMSMTYTTTQSAHDTQMLPDELLELVNSDYLTDDLFQHVAKLVDDKNLQEVIDQQMQGSSVTSISSCAIAPQPPIQTFSTMSKPNVIQTTVATPTKTCDDLKSPVNMLKTPTTPANLLTPTTNKREIKVKRADGSFITLPPIEAPTTRGAKRRAETTPGSETQQKQKVFTVIVQTDSPAHHSQKSVPNTPTIEPIKITPIGSAPKAKPILARERRASVAVKRASPDSKPRRSLSISNPPPATTVNDDDDDDEEDGSDGSYNSEDDPNRIWCICRTPHNNRFMICCDKCEEWFHGKCVGITRQMGRDMEQRQAEWICPNCNKKRQPSIQNIFPRKVVVENSPKTKESFAPNCVVCGVKPSRSNSIYCSDDCIRKHATKAVSITASASSASESDTTPSLKSPPEKKTIQPKIMQPLFKDKTNHVVIYDKVTNTFLTGKNAPTHDKLQQWLAEHPNHEILKPGSKKAEEFKAKQADAFKKKQQQLKTLAKNMAVEKELFAVTQAAKIQTTLQFESNKMVYAHPTTQKQVTTTSTLKRPISATSSPVHSKSPASRSGEPITKAPRLSSSPVATQKYSVQKKRTPDSKTPSHNKSDSKSNEQDRWRARKSLIEQLVIRTKEITDANVPRLTESEITEFINAAELEMFEIFGGDTNLKYRSKYRSLMHNIKDRKNLTLFEKISSKAIEPRQLVRMSTEELASQELAKWRENETKHQLEMITKTELDMLACGNSYVLKTHKGEEVIQEERTIPVEELVSVLNSTAVSSSDAVLVTKDSRVDKYLSADGGRSTSSKSANKKDGERDKKDRHESRSSGSSSKHKRKRSRERHSSHSGHSHSHKDKSHDKDRKERSGSSGGGSSVGIDNRKDKKDHKSSSSSSSSSSGRGKHHIDKERKRDSTSKTIVNIPKNQQTDDSSIADKILKAQSTIDSILHPEEFKKSGDTTTTTTTNVSSATEGSTTLLRQPSATANESDQEPTSTVTIPSPPEVTSEMQSTTPPPPLEKPHASIVWSGNISMVDVATFQVSLSPLSGSTAMIEFPKEFDVVGRINPETVWDYLEKIRISKDIVLLKFSPRSTSEDNGTAYTQFITYLDARKRLGVIKFPSKMVKDFYIMPLTSHRSLPSILKSTTGFDLGADRPDLLLGIIVRNRISAQSSQPPVPSKHRQSIPFIGHKSTSMTIPSKDVHYTPPSSPNLNILVQTISKQVIKSTFSSNLDDDEPYSPGGSDDDDLALSTIPSSYLSSTSGIANQIPDYSKPIGPSSLSSFDKQQLEELNRQIEAEKKEIAMHLQTVDIDEPYSPTSSVSPPINQNLSNVVSNISIPANLADILKNVASFGSTTATMNMPMNQYSASLMDTSDNEYVPMAPVTSTISYAPAPSSQLTQPIAATDASSQPSKLAQLTDEELMRLVPDEID